ncbi:hypothetical protein MUP79_06065, partial [Candidatus Bathyarchaeota archaeon]|nr:hypothetical protein [Candidatus Bathyarchaeota archaeon]
VCLYMRGIRTLSRGELPSFTRRWYGQSLLVTTWPMVIFSLLACYALAGIWPDHFVFGAFTLLVFSLVHWLLLFFVRDIIVDRTARKARWSDLSCFKARVIVLLFFLWVAFIPYVLVMSFFCADVDIEIENKFYSPGEEVKGTARPIGYVFLPDIEGISYDSHAAGFSPGYQLIGFTFHVKDQGAFPEFIGPDFLDVSYRTQGIGIKRSKLLPIPVVRHTLDVK